MNFKEFIIIKKRQKKYETTKTQMETTHIKKLSYMVTYRGF